MNNRLNLEEYLYGIKDYNKKRDILRSISIKMHKFHNDGYLLKDISLRTINLGFTNPTDVSFSYCSRFDKVSMEDMIDYKMKNVISLAVLMLSLLVDSDNNMVILNIDVIRGNFDRFKDLLEEDDFNYLKRVLIDGEFLYYDDFVSQNNNISDSEGAFVSCFLLTVNIVVILLLSSCIWLYLR